MADQSPLPDLSFEQHYWSHGDVRVTGVDEVGRGCLAGPVVAAAVIVGPAHNMIAGVNDSKKIPKKKREKLADQIRESVSGYAIGVASVSEIDQLNIRNATHLAMRRALRNVDPVDYALIDGLDPGVPELGAYRAIQKGDQRCYSIACASIIAKVLRDQIMLTLSAEYPNYGWDTNAGYGTKAHLEGLMSFGATPHHRRSFAPVRAALPEMK